jgi:hypothetical protein
MGVVVVICLNIDMIWQFFVLNVCPTLTLTALFPAGNDTKDSDPHQRQRVFNLLWGSWSHSSDKVMATGGCHLKVEVTVRWWSNGVEVGAIP